MAGRDNGGQGRVFTHTRRRNVDIDAGITAELVAPVDDGVRFVVV